jgi:hypothetical protein
MTIHLAKEDIVDEKFIFVTAGQTPAQHFQNLVVSLVSRLEAKAGLLVGQYKQNGTKILDNVTRKQETERATILQKLNQKKKEIVSIYTEAKEFVMETVEDLKCLIGWLGSRGA